MPKKKHEERPHHAPSVICYVFLGWKPNADFPPNPRRIDIPLARKHHYNGSDKRCTEHCGNQCQVTDFAGRGN